MSGRQWKSTPVVYDCDTDVTERSQVAKESYSSVVKSVNRQFDLRNVLSNPNALQAGNPGNRFDLRHRLPTVLVNYVPRYQILHPRPDLRLHLNEKLQTSKSQ